MHRHGEVITGITLAATIAAGLSGCSNNPEKVPDVFTQSIPKLHDIAEKIVSLTNKSPNSFINKPEFVTGFTIEQTDGSTLTFAVQLPEVDSLPSAAKKIEILQRVPGTKVGTGAEVIVGGPTSLPHTDRTFRLSFALEDNGYWSSGCSSTSSGSFSNTVHTEIITDVNELLDEAALHLHDSTMPAAKNLCQRFLEDV